jgi:uncharacterized protein (DUF1330 family)
MTAYVIASIDVTDPAGYEEYRKLAAASLGKYQGKFIVRGGASVPLEGSWNPPRVVVCEFPSMELAQAWYNSPEYAPAIAIAKRTAKRDLIAVEGV